VEEAEEAPELAAFEVLVLADMLEHLHMVLSGNASPHNAHSRRGQSSAASTGRRGLCHHPNPYHSSKIKSIPKINNNALFKKKKELLTLIFRKIGPFEVKIVFRRFRQIFMRKNIR
jgi:hypothetical protein